MASRLVVVVVLLLSACAWATPVRVACLGDSITATAAARDTITFPGRLEIALNGAHPGGYTVGNFGVSATTTSQHVTTWANSIRSKGYDVLVLLTGVNDFATGVTGATAWTNADTIITQALADGLTVVVVTTLPWGGYSGWTAGKQTETDTFLTSLRARASITLVDTYPAFETAAGSDLLKASYNDGAAADGLHLDTDGDNALVAAIRAAWGV